MAYWAVSVMSRGWTTSRTRTSSSILEAVMGISLTVKSFFNSLTKAQGSEAFWPIWRIMGLGMEPKTGNCAHNPDDGGARD